MDPFSWTELVGYLASALVVISLMMARLLWLRIVNLVGAATFTLYGALIGSPPVMLTNGAIVLIDIWYLWRMTRTETWFSSLEVDAGSRYLQQFLDFYGDDVRRFQPGAELEPDARHHHLFVLRDMVPAGLFVAAPPDENGDAEVIVDYAIPGYRDYRIGRYLHHDRAEAFRERGVRRFVARPGDEKHAAYLERMGYRRVPDDAAGELLVRPLG